MGDFWFWYIIFALTTTITSNFLLLVPIMRELTRNYSDNPQIQPMLNGKVLVTVVFNIASFIFAPLIFVAMIIEEKRGGFIQAFIKGALTHDKS